MKKLYIGMDVHCKTIFCVVQNEQGEVVKESEVPTRTEEIEKFLRGLGGGELIRGTEIGMESGHQATWLSRFLSSLGMKPIVIDAREVRAKARRIGQKSDWRDAFEICDGIRRGIYQTIVYIPDKKIQRLRNIIRRRRHYVRVCTGEINAAKAMFRANGIDVSEIFLKQAKNWEMLFESVEEGDLVRHAKMHYEVWKIAVKKVKELEEELKEALEPYKEIVEILMSAPGVGLITAATYIAIIGTPERFVDSSRVVSYIGLAISTYNSGGKERHGHITKRGAAELRAMLCEAAQQARNPQNPLNPYFMRICGKHGYKRAIVSVAHRLAQILYRMWRDKKRFDINKLNIEKGEYHKIRKIYYKIKVREKGTIVK